MKTLAELLESRVKIGEQDSCWPWEGALTHGGYGNVCTDRRGKAINRRAHRLAWTLENRKRIPDGMVVMHLCNNPRCCNPKHLKLGPNKENTAHMDECNRRGDYTGELHGQSKLTWDDVRLIRRVYPQGRTTMEALASWFKVSRKCISKVLNHITWKE